jgi:hypothetical protein
MTVSTMARLQYGDKCSPPTATKNDTLNPNWGTERLHFRLSEAAAAAGQGGRLEVFDKDVGSKDELIGHIKFALPPLLEPLEAVGVGGQDGRPSLAVPRGGQASGGELGWHPIAKVVGGAKSPSGDIKFAVTLRRLAAT